MTALRGHICIRRQAKDGATGAAGRSIRNTVWETGRQYCAGDTLVDGVYPLDIVSDKAMAIGTSGVNFYMCIKTHTSSSGIPLSDTTYWTRMNSLRPIVTYLILAEAIKANYIDVADLVANSALISNLLANSTFTEELGATSAFINSLVANSAFVENLAAANAFLDNLIVKKLATRGDTSMVVADNEIKLFDGNAALRTWLHGNELTDRSTATTKTIACAVGLQESGTEPFEVTVNSGTFSIGQSGDTVKLYSGHLYFGVSGVWAPDAPSSFSETFHCVYDIKIKNLQTLAITTVYHGTTSMLLEADPDEEGGAIAVLTIPEQTPISGLSSGAYEVFMTAQLYADSGSFYDYFDDFKFEIFDNTTVPCNLVVTNQNSSVPQIMEVAKNGLQIFASSIMYLRLGCVKGNDGILTQGGFQVRCGSYGFMIHPSLGYMKWDNTNQVWSSISL